MTNEYISREDVLNLPQSIERNLRGEIVERSIDVKAIESLPSADVAPVVHARWVNGSCDNCGRHAPYWLMSSTYYESDFCPNCGAKMDGEE